MTGIDNLPHDVDLYVGGRVKMRRKFLGMSQEALAMIIGLTFQQVQKYERGANRISASKLFEMSQALKVPVTYFFEGFGDRDNNALRAESPAERAIHSFLTTSEGIALAEAFPRIRSAKQRRCILELVRALAEDDDA